MQAGAYRQGMMEDYRSQALRMLARWGEEMDRLEVRGQHPLQTLKETPGSRDGDGRDRKTQPSARGSESRRWRPQRVPIRELSGEAQRMHRILGFVRDEDGEAYRVLELVARGVTHAEAEVRLSLDRFRHRAAMRAGMAMIVTILKLKAM